MIKISTSILSAKNHQEAIMKLNDTTTDYIHIDVMDGIFVKNKTFDKSVINNLLAYSKKPIDIHLMTTNPDEYINYLNNKYIEYIIIHQEIKQNIDELIKKIKNKGYKVGIAINPKTKVRKIKKYLKKIDLVLIMSVNPGYGGQSFIPNTIKKIKKINKIKKNVLIEVDGGINQDTIDLIKDQVDIAVAGSYIINNNNYQEAINNLKK